MQTAECLNSMIDRLLSGEEASVPVDETLAPAQHAAERLLRLREIALPSEFAHRLEASLRACARRTLDRQ